MKETKQERFFRVAEVRVNKIIHMLRLLGNCSQTVTYQYDQGDVNRIFARLEEELNRTMERFAHPHQKRFTLSDLDMPDAAPAYPSVTLDLPDETRIRAVAVDDENFPAINIEWLHGGEPEKELLCFIEYNVEQDEKNKICIGVYDSQNEDTVYYAPYNGEKEKL